MACKICEKFHFNFCGVHLGVDRAARSVYFLGLLFVDEQKLRGLAALRDATELIGCVKDYPERWWAKEVSVEMAFSLSSSSLTILSLAHEWNLIGLGKHAQWIAATATTCSGVSFAIQAWEAKKDEEKIDRVSDSLFYFAEAMDKQQYLGIVTGAWGVWATIKRDSYCHG